VHKDVAWTGLSDETYNLVKVLLYVLFVSVFKRQVKVFDTVIFKVLGEPFPRDYHTCDLDLAEVPQIDRRAFGPNEDIVDHVVSLCEGNALNSLDLFLARVSPPLSYNSVWR